MSNILDNKLLQQGKVYLTATEIAVINQGTPDSRYGKVKRLLAKGELLRLVYY